MGRAKRGRLSEAKQARGGGRFVALPLAVLRSPELAALSPHAIKLLVDILAQYNPTLNNGDLSAAWTLMKARGWKSKQTLQKARDELIERNFLTVTRQGGRHVPSLYAVTFFRIDECGGKHDRTPTAAPTNQWMNGNSGAPPIGAMRH